MDIYKWFGFLLIFSVFQSSNSDFFLTEHRTNESTLIGHHRIIKRYSPHSRLPYPNPHHSTLSRPAFPLFPVYRPPPGHTGTGSGDETFPKIRLRPPSDENLYTEEDEDEPELDDTQEETLQQKRRKKPKGNNKHQPPKEDVQVASIEEEAFLETTNSKGDDDIITTPTKKPSRGKSKGTTTSSPTTEPPKKQEDRTLLTAKKALLIKSALVAKKAYILSKLGKKGLKKAALAYGLAKAGKVKGLSVKAPGINFSVGAQTKVTSAAAAAAAAAAKVKEEDEEAIAEDDIEDVEGEEGDDDDNDDDDDDEDTEGLGNTDDDDDAIVITPAPAGSPTETLAAVNTSAENPATFTSDSGINQQQQQYANSMTMMQQLQQQLLQKENQHTSKVSPEQAQQYAENEKQQQQMMMQMHMHSYGTGPYQMSYQAPEKYQNPMYTPTSPRPELYKPHQPEAGTSQAIVVLPSSIPPLGTSSGGVDLESYKGGSKSKSKGKKSKKKKKKKGKLKPRPVNLGVKANLYKKFDTLAHKAKKKLSSFVQIDVAFLGSVESKGMSNLNEAAANTMFASRSLEVSKEIKEDDHRDEPVEDLQSSHEHMVTTPANFYPPWVQPEWKREYPKMKSKCGDEMPCDLKPVWILIGKRPSNLRMD